MNDTSSTPYYTNHFGIVCEGVTDYPVLKYILYGYFGEINITRRQPDLDATGESLWQTQGTWGNVFRYLKEKKYRDDLSASQYLIIQIDTDVSEEPGYDVPQREGGKELEPSEMVKRVIRRLKDVIGEDDLAYYKDRILFAICVRELECWLLPLWDKSKAGKYKGCLGALNEALRSKDKHIITEPKTARYYDELAREYRKKKLLLSEGKKNPSLSIFLDLLTGCSIQNENE